MFLLHYVLLYVLIKSCCKLLEDGDNAETCRSRVIERIHSSINFAIVGVTKVLRGLCVLKWLRTGTNDGPF